MTPVLVAEVLDKSGRVHSRFRLEHFPVTIGRGYHNDIILDDEFVCASHARIELDEGGRPVVVDLGSENGTYLLPSLQRLGRAPLGEESLLRVGHTLIRLRSADYVVPPARRDSLGLNRASRWLTQGTRAAAAYAALLVLVMLEHHQASAQVVGVEQALLAALPVALIIPVWAGLWTLVSRSFAHHPFFVPHFGIASAGAVLFLVLDTAAEYYAFVFSAGRSADLLFQALTLLVAAAMFYGHLRFATLLTPRVVAASALLAATALVGVVSFSDYVAGMEFSDELPYPGELKPPLIPLAKGVSPAEFTEAARQLTPLLDAGEVD